MVCGYVLSNKHGYKGSGRKATFGEILKALKDAIFALMVPLIVLEGLTEGSQHRPKPASSPLSIPLLALLIALLFITFIPGSALWLPGLS